MDPPTSNWTQESIDLDPSPTSTPFSSVPDNANGNSAFASIDGYFNSFQNAPSFNQQFVFHEPVKNETDNDIYANTYNNNGKQPGALFIQNHTLSSALSSPSISSPIPGHRSYLPSSSSSYQLSTPVAMPLHPLTSHMMPIQQRTPSSQQSIPPPLPTSAAAGPQISSFEAYANGSTSGAIPGLSTKPEVSQSRKRITPQQTSVLEEGFKRFPKPDKEFRLELSQKTGLPQRNIQVSICLPFFFFFSFSSSAVVFLSS